MEKNEIDCTPGPESWKHMGLRLIDFGRSVDTRLFPPRTIFFGNCHVDVFQCIEMLTEKPWTYQVDIFGICAVVHCLLHGNYMEVIQDPKTNRWKDKEPFKRYWESKLWIDFFDTFLNIPDCTNLPSLTNMRRKFENFLYNDQSRMRVLKEALMKQRNMI